jgi:hypothetical protein
MAASEPGPAGRRAAHLRSAAGASDQRKRAETGAHRSPPRRDRSGEGRGVEDALTTLVGDLLAMAILYMLIIVIPA